MADNIVGNLFGVTPEMFQQAQTANAQAQAMQFAKLDPMQQSQYAMYSAGQNIPKAVGGLLGVEDPQLAMIRDVQQMRSQFDVSTPTGLRQYAQALGQKGYTDFAIQASQKAADIDKDMATAERARREPGQVNFQQLLSSAKYTPASVAKFKDSQNPADLVLVKGAAGEGEGTGPGPVGKTGAYRNIYNEIIPGSAMTKQREGFEKAEKLLANLNTITSDDIKNSESWLDWTSGENKKQIGGKVAAATVAAQSKINASQLLKQIDSLPPGSASNADMTAAKSSFPGYGNAANLEQWVKDTKETLNDSLARQSERYGFTQKVTPKQDYSSDFAKYQTKYGANAKYKTYEEYVAARKGR